MALTLVSVEDTYSIYEDEHGDEVLIALLLPYRRVVLWDDFDLGDAWQFALIDARKNQPYWAQPDRQQFVADVTLKIADHYNVDVMWCQDCDFPIKGDEAESVNNGTVCTSCLDDNYRSCYNCDDLHHYESMTYTSSDESVCDYCRDRYYSYCEECDVYYHDDYVDDHHHGGCDCESPAQHFAMRHGDGTVAADERFDMTLPAGVISDEGLQSIARLVRNHGYNIPEPEGLSNASWEDRENFYLQRNKWWNLAQDVLQMDPTWQTKDGNFTKRLSKLAHKTQGLKVPQEIMTQVGNIGRDNSAGAEVSIELTRNLNLPAEDFYHEDSCWWQSYSDSRCSLKQNGGIGMRTFNGRSYVSGRAWIMPLVLDENGKLQPTFDAVKCDAYMVFNGYGDLSGYVPARIVADMAGMTYRKVQFSCNPMYVNNSAGYLVAGEDIAAKFPAGSSVHLDTNTHSTLFSREQAAALVGA